MEENKVSVLGKNKIILLLVGLIIVATVVAAVFLLNGSDGYRLIKIYQVNGSAVLERENTGEIDAYENLVMQNEDLLKVAQESNVRLQMDEDKYALVEQGSVLSIEADGDSENSKTNIMLQSGAVTIEIQNKLSSQSTYQVTTPNSVMAVRGTVFRVEVTQDEKGRPVTKVTIFEGSVGVSKKAEDGSMTEEQLIEYGKQVIIYTEDDELVLEIIDTIPFDELPIEVLQYLAEIVDSGRNISISKAELDKLLAGILGKMEETEETEETESTEEMEETEIVQDIEAGTEESSEVPSQAIKQVPAIEPTTDADENPIEEPTEQPTEEPTEAATVCTVTFMYQGNEFGKQEINSGETVQEPKLSPAESGNWDFDFSTAITADTVIEFKE